MAAVLSPRAFNFPHNILQETRDTPSILKMDRTSPPRPSLPSISSLINDVDMQTETASLRSPALEQQRKAAPLSQPPTPDRASFPGSPYSRLPPSPPLPGTSSFDFIPRSSPGLSSPTGYSLAANGYFAPSPVRTNPEAYASLKTVYPPLSEQQQWGGNGSPTSSRRTSDHSDSITSARSTKSDSSGSEISDSSSTHSGLSQQLPLPANFPPSMPSPGQQLPPIDSQMASNQYQHHHHYSAASSPSYSPTSDRYQCPTCQKAFSRPSSLKIHIYSHTGEKPFKCKYDGCGKFFSVRSNMKRHEKGCHGVDTSSNGGNSPKSS